MTSSSSLVCTDQEIRSHMNAGLHNFSQLIDYLHQSSITSHTASDASTRLRPVIESLYQNFWKAKNKCELTVDKLQRKIETIARDIGSLERNESSLKNDINRQKIKLSGLEKTLGEQLQYHDDCRGILEEKDRACNHAQDRLRDAERDQAITAGVGAGLLVIPVVGWIAGAVTLVVSFTALEANVKSAQSAKDSASDTYHRSSQEYNRTNDNLNSLRDKIGKEKDRLNGISNKLNLLKLQKGNHHSQLRDENEMKDMMNKCFTFISGAFGKARNMRESTRHFYDKDQLVNPLQWLAKHFLDARSTDYQRLMGNFEIEMKKLESIAKFAPLQITSGIDDFC